MIQTYLVDYGGDSFPGLTPFKVTLIKTSNHVYSSNGYERSMYGRLEQMNALN